MSRAGPRDCIDVHRPRERMGPVAHVALSEPLPEDHWSGSVGFIHEVLRREYLSQHPDPTTIEYYLCGPPAMIEATRELLARLKVPESQIAYDEF